MVPEVVLHIGLFKTGSTSIQRFLRDHPQVLAAHGYRFPEGWLRRDAHLEPHFVFMRLDRDSSARAQGTEWLDPAWRADVWQQLASDLTAPGRTIWSSEHLSLLRFDDEIAPLRLLTGDATVILYTRERVGFLASLRDQLVKNGIAPSTDPASHAYVEPDSWRADHDGLIAAWSRHYTNLHVLDYDQVTEDDGSVIPSFLRVLGIPERPGDVDTYWLNPRGATDPRIPGTRQTGGRFGSRSDEHDQLIARLGP